MPVTIVTVPNPTEADTLPVWTGLKAYNDSQTALPLDRQDVCILARDGQGETVGGLVGYTQWTWLYVDLLWMADGQRGGGLGQRLMAAAEQEGRERGCTRARLYTYDFQAPGFYEKLGYEQWCVMEDYPPGHRMIWYRKTIA